MGSRFLRDSVDGYCRRPGASESDLIFVHPFRSACAGNCPCRHSPPSQFLRRFRPTKCIRSPASHSHPSQTFHSAAPPPALTGSRSVRSGRSTARVTPGDPPHEPQPPPLKSPVMPLAAVSRPPRTDLAPDEGESFLSLGGKLQRLAKAFPPTPKKLWFWGDGEMNNTPGVQAGPYRVATWKTKSTMDGRTTRPGPSPSGSIMRNQATGIGVPCGRNDSTDQTTRRAARGSWDGTRRSNQGRTSQCNPTAITGFYADLLQSALEEVNWLEIAENFLGELRVDERGGGTRDVERSATGA